MPLESSRDSAVTPAGARQREIPGHWVVLGMFVFGIAATTVLWTYWHLHTAPFRPLQNALAAEFPGSQPRVEGGQRKMHRDTPRILRIVMKVGFNPVTEKARSEEFADGVTGFVREHHDLAEYDELEIHLFWPEPEARIRERTITREVSAIAGER